MIPSFDRVVILADESANWRIAGLRQLDRLALAMDEFARSISSQRKIEIVIFWRPDISAAQRWEPNHPRLTRCQFVEGLSVGANQRLLNTRLLVKRTGVEQLLSDVPALLSSIPHSAMNRPFGRSFGSRSNMRGFSPATKAGVYLDSLEEVPSAELWLIRGSGKSRDGFVSRYFNRPISRAVSRLLVKTSMTPNASDLADHPVSRGRVFSCSCAVIILDSWLARLFLTFTASSMAATVKSRARSIWILKKGQVSMRSEI